MINIDQSQFKAVALAMGLMIIGDPMPASAQTFTFSGLDATVPANTAYDAARGYGFVLLPDRNAQAFSLRAAPGDYRVSVTLGGPKTSRTSVWVEDRRLMAGPVDLKAGETRTLTFTVNVRDTALIRQETDPDAPQVRLRGDDAAGFNWDDQLTLIVSGGKPSLNAITVEPVTARRILLAGDSTVTDQAGGDYASWGQMLPRFLSPDLSVANHARSGETMKSFLTSLRWDKLLSEIRPDDVVLIQFGHNDEKKQWPRTYAAPEGAYSAYLTAFVADVRLRGGWPVLVTPVARRTFKGNRIENSHAGYDNAVRATAMHLNVPLIDLTRQTSQFYEALGPELAPLAFADHNQEKTHHNAYGAYMIACFVAHDLANMSVLKVKAAADLPVCSPEAPGDPHAFVITPADWPQMRVQADQAPEPTPVK
ncbi:GDSL-type esterase/lipase family protein [Asticcacaulis taihuensis]|uniref:rhamnogalacturonan acetylesterase n=1 Tax=Asticcacaulis taihuensis TaxID=260084 RepID=UPI003F7C448B